MMRKGAVERFLFFFRRNGLCVPYGALYVEALCVGFDKTEHLFVLDVG